MASRTKLQDRYKLGDVLGRGGMGVVYKAYDTLMNREVALKTILDVENTAALELFYKEWGVQASIVHPNIAEIYDIGEFEENGERKPFFVMPLLPGVTLDKLIREGSPTLTIERSVGIIAQACRGLQAAHERGLVHRDLKPSNVFVMSDDSVKIIDFGVAHIVETGSRTTLKGTLSYMAPEQLQMKPPSALSDIFSLAVVCYETLTRRRPFQGRTEHEITEAILHQSPPPISELNPAVNESISRVVHKALAKQPWHRFSTVREFGDTVQKALRNEPIEIFDTSKIKPRIDRATKSFEEGDYNFASELLSELEGEGLLDPAITLLRRQLDQAVRKTTIRQLLESARRFFEAEEYSLSLRKIQEALELDADDPDVLSLKNEVEKERRKKKIDEWFQLAREHLENQSFGQARQALDNVLKIKPNDTQALRLSAEVDRQEQELTRVRQEKKELYQAAMQAWEKGEVSASLSKLELLVSLESERPETDTDRGGTYQKFYNQVRSEHDNIKNSYTKARKHLADDDFESARSICEQNLAKYPNHALFQALKFDLEERQRQKLSAFIAETDRRADDEPDLDRRLGILEEALKLYPGEQHFERAIRLVREKRDLVNSIVSKARFFEERKQLNEALDQWQILKSIHEKYPGLQYEVERLIKRRDQQARTEAKARWGEQIDRALESGDYDQAVKVSAAALVEFPDDAALLELQKLAAKSQERSAQALELLGQGRELCDAGRLDEGLDLLRKAYELDKRNSVIQRVLVNSLLDRARNTVDSDWENADHLVKEILDLDPTHSSAQVLSNQISDRKREDFVSWCLAQARRLQAEGDMDGARAVVEQGLGSYPEEPRLTQLLGTVTRAQVAPKKGARPSDLEELKRLEREVASEVTPARRAELEERIRVLAERNPKERGIQVLADRLQRQLTPESTPAHTLGAAAGQAAEGASQSAASAPPSADLEQETPAGAEPHRKEPPDRHKPARRKKKIKKAAAKKARPGVSAVAAREWLAKQTAQVGPLVNKAVEAVKSARHSSPRAAIVGGVLALLTVAVGLVIWLMVRSEPAPVVPASFAVSIQTSPPGATILVNDEICGTSDCELELEPGSYRAVARLAGHEPAMVSFDINPQEPPSGSPIVLMLEPLSPVIQLTSDLAGGEVALDGEVVGKLDEGQFVLASVSPGEHSLTVSERGSQATINFEVAPGSLPLIRSPIETRNLRVGAVSSMEGMARVYADGERIEAVLDDRSVGEVAAQGLELTGLAAGSHQVTLGSNDTQTSVVFDSGPVPTLTAFLKSDRNVGGLRIVTAEDDVTVYLNGQEYRRKTQRGRVLVYLLPKQYTVRVEKEGFRPVPEQTVEVRKGEEARLEFELTPSPQIASLRVRDGVPGTEVLVDGRAIGTIRPGENSATFTVTPGRHAIVLRRGQYKPKQLERNFGAGDTVELDGAMVRAVGTLQIDVSPSGLDVSMTLRREGDAGVRSITDRSLELPEGTYTVTANAPGYDEFGATVRLAADETKVARLTLRRQAAAKRAEPIDVLAAWEKAGGWSRQGKLLVRRGGDFVLAPVEPAAGTYSFTVFLQRGRRLEWVVNYIDKDNHVLCQIDRNNFNRVPVVKGKKEKEAQTPHKIDRDEFISIQVGVTPDGIVHRLHRDGQWVVIDTWPEPNPLRGKFGFHVSGRNQIGLSHFNFIPR